MSIPSFYKSLEDLREKPEDWNTCQLCETKPRLWIFDNGRHARCECKDSAVQAISIWQYHEMHNGDMTNYDNSPLRDAWNSMTEKRLRRSIHEKFEF